MRKTDSNFAEYVPPMNDFLTVNDSVGDTKITVPYVKTKPLY